MKSISGRARSRAVVALTAVVASITLAACSAGDVTAGNDDQLVGVAMPTTTSARWVADGKNVEAQLEALGYTVDLEYAEDDVPTQVAQIQKMIDDGADLLIVGSIDGTALTAQLAAAAAADIPVIAYDRLIRDSADVDYYATFDNHRVGVQQATMLLEGLGVVDDAGAPTGATGPFVVELFAGSPDDNNATVFYDAAMDTLQPYIDRGVLQVPSGETDFETVATLQWNGDTAAERMNRLLADTYAGTDLVIDGVLAPNDGIAIALLAALAADGYGTDAEPLPVTTGQDAEIPSVKSIIAGEQYATIYKDTRQLAEVAVSMGDALLKGEEPEVNDVTSYDNGVQVVPTYLLAPVVVDASNYEALLVGGGYYTEDELR
ncbi:multiple monosaccharide ABC transporter substrate-binding protein [Sanguibacter antarcticus]|uniref:Monosaccharide ABC transporter substrate-binding protein (CUT2 family) n=1 Tax=Sanguibacter antarcticus TaxID=372484 RepID=A0A2A9E242_9MICO|nr:multiple monosaccharide ABC transporter substrate-binding protein [Sanguibacter antarcticus]PFG32259.1 monosaccharide ABC transporter substrate-binding protein (CUT2 family) [Sanguibacter antarcticus]